jgi:DNA-binding transcriptional ArsR family regulator
VPAKNSKPPNLTNSQLLTAVSHRTRAQLLKILNERTETPKNLAKELGCAIRHVEYHLGVLEGLGCVELVKTDKSPGGKVIAHHYRALKRFWLDRDAWVSLDPKEQPGVTTDILRLMGEDMARALVADTIDEGGNHISRTPLLLDAAGYEALIALLSDTLDQVVTIQVEAGERLEEDESTPIFTKVHIVQFISPDPE